MKIALVQLKPDTQRIIEYTATAVRKGCDIICFPEMALCGYSFEDISESEIKQRKILDTLSVLSKKHSITILIGGIEKSSKEEGYYITQFVISHNIQGYRKTHLGLKEKPKFLQGDSIPVFESNGITFGIMTCYDSHFPEVSTILANKGAKIIFNPSANANEPVKRVDRWAKYLVARAYDNRVWVMANNLIFKNRGGGMIVYNSDGEIVNTCTETTDEIMFVDYISKEYPLDKMCNRDFKADRREDLYLNNNGGSVE